VRLNWDRPGRGSTDAASAAVGIPGHQRHVESIASVLLNRPEEKQKPRTQDFLLSEPFITISLPHRGGLRVFAPSPAFSRACPVCSKMVTSIFSRVVPRGRPERSISVGVSLRLTCQRRFQVTTSVLFHRLTFTVISPVQSRAPADRGRATREKTRRSATMRNDIGEKVRINRKSCVLGVLLSSGRFTERRQSIQRVADRDADCGALTAPLNRGLPVPSSNRHPERLP